jgi:hypothetical protein
MTRPNLATWHFAVDWDADGDWDDPGEDVTEYVQAAQWRLGMHQPWQLTADETTCSLTLVNADRRFSPEFSGSPLYGLLLPQRRIRIAAEAPIVLNDGATQVVDSAANWLVTELVTLWTGWISSLAPAPMQHAGPFLTTITGVGAAAFLKAAALDLPLFEHVRAETLIAAIFARSTFPPSALGGSAWAIGITGRSEIGQTTAIGSTTAFYALEPGLVSYAYAGDNWDRFASAYEGLVSVAQAERGRLFFGRDGRATFWNRRHVQSCHTVEAVYEDSMQGLTYSYGDDVVNDVRVTVYPRAVSATNDEILWQLDAPLMLHGGETREIRLRYAAADGQQVAGRNVVQPNIADGSLTFSRGSAAVSKFETDARSAAITLKNNSSRRDCTVATMIVKGQKLTSWNAQEVSLIDPVSIAAYGRQIERTDARLLEDVDFAHSIAESLLINRSRPRGLVRALRLMNRDAPALGEMLYRTMGDRVTVRETQTATEGDYLVVGEAHDWREGGRSYTATLSLEPVPPYEAWLIGIAGRSSIAQTTVIGF